MGNKPYTSVFPFEQEIHHFSSLSLSARGNCLHPHYCSNVQSALLAVSCFVFDLVYLRCCYTLRNEVGFFPVHGKFIQSGGRKISLSALAAAKNNQEILGCAQQRRWRRQLRLLALVITNRKKERLTLVLVFTSGSPLF